jgi:citrate lyase subunit gamma (acyl carrier protein)
LKKYEIKKQATAGTLESSDLQIIITNNDNNGIDIDLKSSVEKQYGRRIRQVIEQTLDKMGITDAKLIVIDKGALDCTIVARTVGAVHRACDITSNYDWEEIDSWSV